MPIRVYVVTAAQFVADLYEALAQGQTLGEAVSSGRKQLDAKSERAIFYAPRSLQDWSVPVVYEAMPVALFSPRTDFSESLLGVFTVSEATSGGNKLAKALQQWPDAGFFGRDETLVALDRAFDTQQIVLLHAFAGSGKTTTAAEFARWYSFTGGVKGRVLFTSFEHYKPLARVLDAVSEAFGKELQKIGVNWFALSDEERRICALKVLQTKSVLWVWDNVEQVAGFPAGIVSSWGDDEQRELADFLRDARNTKAKFLLTSRREEQAWLGGLPARILVPPMPMLERIQLAKALIEKQGRRLSNVDDWLVLLRFTQGNPLTITVVVGQAVRDALQTKTQTEDFVAKLRAGESVFTDEVREGRSKSLGASLDYGFEYAFTEEERKILSLLHLFQGFVDVDVLRFMGVPESSWCLPEVQGLTRESGMALLDRAAEAGMLTTLGGGYYTIHPALPWFFKARFDRYFFAVPSYVSSNNGEMSDESGVLASRAFSTAVGVISNYYHDQLQEGNNRIIENLSAEKDNLLYVWHLARKNHWWVDVISVMQGLDDLYEYTGRSEEWKQMVQMIAPAFVDKATDGPLTGREEEWGIVNGYRVRLAMGAHDWIEAKRLQQAAIDVGRSSVDAVLLLPEGELNDIQRVAVRNLASSLQVLGGIMGALDQSESIAILEESMDLLKRTGNQQGAAISAFNLGHAYKDISGCRDLAQAEHWYRQSMAMRDERDLKGRAYCQAQIGNVAYERFREARAAQQTEHLIHHINNALSAYHFALTSLPGTDVTTLAIVHRVLGSIYGDGGRLEVALPHYHQSIRYSEQAGDLHGAGSTRVYIAIDLVNADRFADAHAYANAALRNFETIGNNAAATTATQGLIASIEQKIQARNE